MLTCIAQNVNGSPCKNSKGLVEGKCSRHRNFGANKCSSILTKGARKGIECGAGTSTKFCKRHTKTTISDTQLVVNFLKESEVTAEESPIPRPLDVVFADIFEKGKNLEKATLHQISLFDWLFKTSVSADVDWNEIEESVIDFMNSTTLSLDLKRGDIVQITDVPNYRNDGKVIWDGQKFKALDSDIDEYGAVPKEFLTIDEFPPMYWEKSITHNIIHHIKAENLTYTGFKDNDLYIYSFQYNGVTWSVGSEEKLSKGIVSVNQNEDYNVDFAVGTTAAKYAQGHSDS